MTDKPKRKSMRNDFIDEVFGAGSKVLPRGDYTHSVYDDKRLKGIKGGKNPYVITAHGASKDSPSVGTTAKGGEVDMPGLKKAGKIMKPYKQYYPNVDTEDVKTDFKKKYKKPKVNEELVLRSTLLPTPKTKHVNKAPQTTARERAAEEAREKANDERMRRKQWKKAHKADIITATITPRKRRRVK